MEHSIFPSKRERIAVAVAVVVAVVAAVVAVVVVVVGEREYVCECVRKSFACPMGLRP